MEHLQEAWKASQFLWERAVNCLRYLLSQAAALQFELSSRSLPALNAPSSLTVASSPPTVTLVILLSLLLIVVLCLFVCRGGRPIPLSPNSRILLIVAHPDDETMFFAPTLQRLSKKHRIYMLCVSTGDFYGQGQTRVRELRLAVEQLGIDPSNLIVLDYDSLKDGYAWDHHELSRIFLRHVEVLDIDVVISFDGGGVSSHPNHVSCFEALQFSYSMGEFPAHTQVFCLDSVSLMRKYISWLDAPLSVIRSPFCYFSSPRKVFRTWVAMRQHRSQLLWFRYLFIIFSRYVVMNTFRRIPPQARVPRQRKKDL